MKTLLALKKDKTAKDSARNEKKDKDKEDKAKKDMGAVRMKKLENRID